jgi:hypothetical protein
MKYLYKISLLGLCAAFSASTVIDAKTMKPQPEAVTTEETEAETTSTPKRMRLLPGAQRRAERRRGAQPQCRGGNCPYKQGQQQPIGYTRRKYVTSKSTITSTNGGVSVNITSPEVTETKDNVVVTMNVGTLVAQDIAVEVEGNDMYITGEYNRSGTQISINDSASLPCSVDVNRMNKKVSNGVLTITLPKVK